MVPSWLFERVVGGMEKYGIRTAGYRRGWKRGLSVHVCVCVCPSEHMRGKGQA